MTPMKTAESAMAASLPGALQAAVAAELAAWRDGGRIKRLWARDASLWTGSDEGRWLGWLDAVAAQRRALPGLRRVAELAARLTAPCCSAWAARASARGSCRNLRPAAGRPLLHVLDSTDPRNPPSSARSTRRAPLLVASKSGGTLEPNILKQYFFARVAEAVGDKEAGRRFRRDHDPAPRCNRSPSATASPRSCSAIRRSRRYSCCPPSAWCRRR